LTNHIIEMLKAGLAFCMFIILYTPFAESPNDL
jgi:hypothetical protein